MLSGDCVLVSQTAGIKIFSDFLLFIVSRMYLCNSKGHLYFR
jgi:hypothetical protein